MASGRLHPTLAASFALVLALAFVPGPAHAGNQNQCHKTDTGGFLDLPELDCVFSCGDDMGLGVEVIYNDPDNPTVHGTNACADVSIGCNGGGRCITAPPYLTTYGSTAGYCHGWTSDNDGYGNTLTLDCWTWWYGSAQPDQGPSVHSSVSVRGVPGLPAQGEACVADAAAGHLCLAVTPTCVLGEGYGCSVGPREIQAALAAGAAWLPGAPGLDA